jgi:hypothetical protein
MGSSIKPSEIIEKKKDLSEIVKKKRKNDARDSSRINKALGKSGVSVNAGISLNDRAEILLGVMHSAIRQEKKNYSLITTCDDTEVIENENILDSTSYSVSPTPTSAKDKFTNVSDPFYSLDSDIPDSYSERNKRAATRNLPDFVCFAAKLYRNNGNNRNSNNTHEATGSMGTAAATTTTTTY